MSMIAKKLRQEPTPAEKRLWRLLYPFRTNGFHFRKQAPVGPYVADFACHHAKLIIEVDGDTHALPGAADKDQKRDAFFAADGYTVMRFSNSDVLQNAEGVYSLIETQLQTSAGAKRPILLHAQDDNEQASK